MTSTIPIVITTSCNRNCSYCFTEPMKDISYEEFKQKLDSYLLENKKITKVAITGGDPVLNKDFFSMCKYVKSKNLRLKIIETHDNEKNMEKYLTLVDEVSIPLDSLDEETNDSLRGKNAYNNSMRAYKKLKNKVRIQIHTVVNSTNIKKIKNIHNWLLSDNFFNKNTWKLFRFTNFQNNKDYSITDEDWNKLKELMNNDKIFFIDNVLEY